MVHVSVKAEPLAEILGLTITNSMVLSWVVMGFFTALAIFYYRSLVTSHKSQIFYLIHSIVLAIYNLIKSVLRDKTPLFFPLLGAYFFYILMNNWMGILPTVGSVLVKPALHAAENLHTDTSKTPYDTQTTNHDQNDKGDAKSNEKDNSDHGYGLIPLFRANTADLNTTFALALITVFMIQFFGFSYNGFDYLKKFVNFSSPIMFFVGILELISEIARILSFSFRLFGNVLAGEILIVIVAFLLPPFASFVMLPFFALEIMAGAIQALVFTMLSTVLIGMATAKTHH